jgi:CelD/BcsL family acetyltransferase involved in cellulose biosynthesis
MKIETIRPSELGASEVARWREMQRTVPTLDNPFLSPEFTIAVGRLRVRARVAVLIDGQSIAGFLQFERRTGGIAVPIGSVLNDCQGVVHADGIEWDPKELLRACHLSLFTFDHLVEGQRPMDRYRRAWFPSPIIDLTPGFDAYRSELESRGSTGVPSQPYDSLRVLIRKERRLGRRVGDLRFEYASSDVSALRTLMSWKSAQYKRSGTFDRFARGWIVDLLHELHAVQSPDFGGLLCTLHAGDQLVAADFLLRTRRLAAEWFPAYDPTHKRNSPGMLIRLRLVERAAREGIGHIDLGSGGEGYKEFFKSSDRFVSAARVARPSVGSVVQGSWQHAQRGLRAVVLGHSGLYRAANHLRTRYGILDAAVRRKWAQDVLGEPETNRCGGRFE